MADYFETGYRFPIQYAVFCSVFHAISFLISPLIVPSFSKFSGSNKIYWYNRNVSVVHACLMTYFGISYFLKEETAVIAPNVSEYQKIAIDVMIGYLIYDTIVELFVGGGKLILAHHVFGLLSHISTRYADCGPAAHYRSDSNI